MKQSVTFVEDSKINQLSTNEVSFETALNEYEKLINNSSHPIKDIEDWRKASKKAEKEDEIKDQKNIPDFIILEGIEGEHKG